MNLSTENNTASSGCKPFDEAAFRRELTKLYPNCLRFARSLTRDADRAADAVQEAMLVVFETDARPSDPDKLTGWLLGVVKNRVYRAGSAASATKAKVDGHQMIVETFGFDRAEQPDDRLEALALLDSRPPSQRLALVEALTGSEIRTSWPRPVHEEPTRDLLRRHYHELSEPQREAIRLVMLEGMGLFGAGKELGVNKAAIRDRLKYAIAAARRLESGAPAAIQNKPRKFKVISNRRPRRLPDVPRWPVLRRGVMGAFLPANVNTNGARLDAAHA